MMKHHIRRLSFLLGIALLFSNFILSCSKEEDKIDQPQITLTHLGSHDHPDSRVVFLDDPIHLEAKIIAEGKVQKIVVEIVQKSGYGTYKQTKEYTGDYVGLTEIPSFHDHPIIESGAAIGEYVLTITVTDQAGQIASISSDFTVEVGGEGGGHEHEH